MSEARALKSRVVSAIPSVALDIRAPTSPDLTGTPNAAARAPIASPNSSRSAALRCCGVSDRDSRIVPPAPGAPGTKAASTPTGNAVTPFLPGTTMTRSGMIVPDRISDKSCRIAACFLAVSAA
ncbi:hypothetical protein [uncultured Tateyamaria sp.]|uniref:hypothetical protein n=1 Tax=uncultured Tateyamaria sp. TaxID=455651 RepID=UPI002611F687|nr:hypothetical protein [uncultured Tateyamaria sp.]